MNTLTVVDDDGTQLLMVRIQDVDPSLALPAILEALRNLPKPRKPRSDKGQPKTTAPT